MTPVSRFEFEQIDLAITSLLDNHAAVVSPYPFSDCMVDNLMPIPVFIVFTDQITKSNRLPTQPMTPR